MLLSSSFTSWPILARRAHCAHAAPTGSRDAHRQRGLPGLKLVCLRIAILSKKTCPTGRVSLAHVNIPTLRGRVRAVRARGTYSRLATQNVSRDVARTRQHPPQEPLGQPLPQNCPNGSKSRWQGTNIPNWAGPFASAPKWPHARSANPPLGRPRTRLRYP